MEVVGVVGSIVGIVDVIARSLSALVKLNLELKQADNSLLTMIGELGTTKAALEQLSQLYSTISPDSAGSYQFEIDLGHAINAAKGLVTIIDEKITSLGRCDPNTDRLNFEGKIRLVLDSAGFEQSLVRLDRLLNAMNLLITAFSSRTASQQIHLLQQATTRDAMDKVREDSASLLVLYDDASFETKQSSSTAGLSAYSRDFEFDNTLLRTKPYKLTLRSLMKRRASGSMTKAFNFNDRVVSAFEIKGYVLLGKLDVLENDLTKPASHASLLNSTCPKTNDFWHVNPTFPIYVLFLGNISVEPISLRSRLKEMQQSRLLPCDDTWCYQTIHYLQSGRALIKQLISWPALFHRSLGSTALKQLDLRGIELLEEISGVVLNNIRHNLHRIGEHCRQLLIDVLSWCSVYEKAKKVVTGQAQEMVSSRERLEANLKAFCTDPRPQTVVAPPPQDVVADLSADGNKFTEIATLYPGTASQRSIRLRLLLPTETYIPNRTSSQIISSFLIPAQVCTTTVGWPDRPEHRLDVSLVSPWTVGSPSEFFYGNVPNSTAIWLLFLSNGWDGQDGPPLRHLEPGERVPYILTLRNKDLGFLQKIPDGETKFTNSHRFCFDMTVTNAFEDGFIEVAKLVQRIAAERGEKMQKEMAQKEKEQEEKHQQLKEESERWMAEIFADLPSSKAIDYEAARSEVTR